MHHVRYLYLVKKKQPFQLGLSLKAIPNIHNPYMPSHRETTISRTFPFSFSVYSSPFCFFVLYLISYSSYSFALSVCPFFMTQKKESSFFTLKSSIDPKLEKASKSSFLHYPICKILPWSGHMFSNWQETSFFLSKFLIWALKNYNCLNLVIKRSIILI